MINIMHGILFPKNYFNSTSPDEAFLQEFEIVKELEIPYAFYDQESLTFDSTVRLHKIDTTVTSYIYRGWMLNEAEYRKLEASVEKAGSVLAVPTEEYLRTHSFDGWYPLFKNYTFPSVILEDPSDEAEVEHAIHYLNSDLFYVKDFVKSDRDFSGPFTADELYKAVNAFKDDRDSLLQGKVVVREYKPLDGDTAEIRVWLKAGKIILFASHPNFTPKLNQHVVNAIEFVKKIEENLFSELSAIFFITIDLARTLTGQWVIVEVGNGQVSGLPNLNSIVGSEEVMKSFFLNLVAD